MKHESLYHSYFKILLKTINKYIWKSLKTTQVQSLDIVVFSPPQICKIQALYKKLEHWQFCTHFKLSAAVSTPLFWYYWMLWCLVFIWCLDEGPMASSLWREEKRPHFYSGEACMKRERSQCASEADLQRQFWKPTLYDHKYLQICQISLTKV